jgi:hypothetical protein
MKFLMQPIPEALEILRRDNPQLKFEASEHGIAMQTKSGDWAFIVSAGYDGKVRVFEPGETTLTMKPDMYAFIYHDGPAPANRKAEVKL